MMPPLWEERTRRFIHRNAWRNCLKSRSEVSRAQKSPAYRSEMSPFAPFRRLLRPSFCGRPDFLDSFRIGFPGSSHAGSCIGAGAHPATMNPSSARLLPGYGVRHGRGSTSRPAAYPCGGRSYRAAPQQAASDAPQSATAPPRRIRGFVRIW